ncbi:hypothetical protein MYXO_02388 [Myxococcaceae bacterium]|nr:hypothetical protein MYXO_02388 [Myxococcaceae bacterium]
MPGRDPVRRGEAQAVGARAPLAAASWLAIAAALLFGTAIGFAAGRSWPARALSAGASVAEDEPDAPPIDPQAVRESFVALDPFIVNLHGDDVVRYLKLRLEIEAESPAVRSELEARLPQLRDGILGVLSDLEVADAISVDGRRLLKRDLESRLNGLLHSGRVRAVLFTEYVVQ